MERYFTFMDKKTQYRQDASSSHIICKLNVIPVGITAHYFMDINKLIPKFIWRGKEAEEPTQF